MPRIAILGGGIAGLAAAFQCEQLRQAGHPLDWHLFEASDRLGHTVSTTRLHTPDGDYLLEDGPDGWVTEKPWARQLAEELGLGPDLIPCNEATKKTYLWLHGELTLMPARMRLMVPEDLATLDTSPLFTPAAKQAYHDELRRAAELRAAAPHADESVASFVLRHFGPEVLDKIAAPLLSGVFGGDVHRLSVRAVMPQFVLMEAQHGSLIAALQARTSIRGNTPPQPTFTSLRHGMGSLVKALIAALPPDRLHTGNRATALLHSLPPTPPPPTAPSPTAPPPTTSWLIRFTGPATAGCSIGFVPFDDLLLATPPAVTAALLQPIHPEAAQLIPTEASSAVLVTFCWPPSRAGFDLPPGFGFLVPKARNTEPNLPPGFGFLVPKAHNTEPNLPSPWTSLSESDSSSPNPSSRPEAEGRSGETPVFRSEQQPDSGQEHESHPLASQTPLPNEIDPDADHPKILAGTFTAQKFPHRAPAGAHVVRVFFSGTLADSLQSAPDAHIAALGLQELRRILLHLPNPDPALTTVRRWPRSLPQYEVGHLDRMAILQKYVRTLGHLHLLGNGYHGVGIPDLIRNARTAARTMVSRT